jgi:hypothetical protein
VLRWTPSSTQQLTPPLCPTCLNSSSGGASLRLLLLMALAGPFAAARVLPPLLLPACWVRSKLHTATRLSSPPEARTPCRTSQHSTAHHHTAQHSTTRHSTAEQSTAQHGTAQHERAHGTGPARCGILNSTHCQLGIIGAVECTDAKSQHCCCCCCCGCTRCRPLKGHTNLCARVPLHTHDGVSVERENMEARVRCCCCCTTCRQLAPVPHLQ